MFTYVCSHIDAYVCVFSHLAVVMVCVLSPGENYVERFLGVTHGLLSMRRCIAKWLQKCVSENGGCAMWVSRAVLGVVVLAVTYSHAWYIWSVVMGVAGGTYCRKEGAIHGSSYDTCVSTPGRWVCKLVREVAVEDVYASYIYICTAH